MQKFLVILLATFLYLPVSGEALGPSQCIWATAPALRGIPITNDDLRKCIEGLIERIGEPSKLREDIEHERQMRRYLETETKGLRSDLEKLEQLVIKLQLELDQIRPKAKLNK